jgi:hypothetical protein
MLLRPDAPAAAAALLADPQPQSLVHVQSAGQGKIHEEPIGLEIVGDVPAVVPGILGAADVGPGRMPAKLGEQPPPAGSQKKQ